MRTFLVLQWLRLRASNAGRMDPWLGNKDPTYHVSRLKEKKIKRERMHVSV